MHDIGCVCYWQLLCITTDSADNNRTMVAALTTSCKDDLPRQFIAAISWICCLAHVLNRAAQDAIKVLKVDPTTAARTPRASDATSSNIPPGDALDGHDIPVAVLKALSLYDQVSPVFDFQSTNKLTRSLWAERHTPVQKACRLPRPQHACPGDLPERMQGGRY